MSRNVRSNRFRHAREPHFGDRNVLCYSERPRDLVTALSQTVAVAGQHEALVDGARRVSFAELWELSGDFARILASRGIGPSDRLALAISNRLEFVVALDRCR